MNFKTELTPNTKNSIQFKFKSNISASKPRFIYCNTNIYFWKKSYKTQFSDRQTNVALKERTCLGNMSYSEVWGWDQAHRVPHSGRPPSLPLRQPGEWGTPGGTGCWCVGSRPPGLVACCWPTSGCPPERALGPGESTAWAEEVGFLVVCCTQGVWREGARANERDNITGCLPKGWKQWSQ